jgi:hypothetical protein
MDVWMALGVNLIAFILFWILIFFLPHKIPVAGIPRNFIEKQFNTGEVTLNYVEGPCNGLPFLLIPGRWNPGRVKTGHVQAGEAIPRVRDRPARAREIQSHTGAIFL